jgi:hypothetical protein
VASLLPNAILLVNHVLNYVFPTHQVTLRFVVSFLIKLILPLQGLFNLIIYVRPRYTVLRREKGDSFSFFSIMSEIIVGVPCRRSKEDEDHADDFAPELAVPVFDNLDSRSEINSGGFDDDHLPSTQDVENICPNTENDNVVEISPDILT